MTKRSLLTAATIAIASLSTLLVQAPNIGAEIVETTSRDRIGVTAKEIVVGSCLPMTGPLTARARTITQGVNTYFSYINEHGGINGRRIKLLTCDDFYDPEKAITCFNSCLKQKVFAGGFFVGSAVITKYVRMADVLKLPMVGFHVAPPTLCELHPTLFNLRPCYVSEINEQIDNVWKHGLKRIAILYQNDALGAGLRQAAVNELTKLKGTPIAEASYGHLGEGSEDAYRAVMASKPQAVVMAGATLALRKIIKLRHEEHPAALFMVISSLGDALLEEGKASNGILVTQVLPPADAPLPSIEQYRQLLQKYYPGSTPHIHGLEGFLNAMVLVEGLKRCGPEPTRTQLVSALESLHDFSIGLDQLHLVSFSKTKHIAWGPQVIYPTKVQDGKLVPFTEADWKEAERANP